MCIAILAPAGKHITDEQIERCWDNNPHGAGFVYVLDGKFVFVKELLKKEKFKKLYHKHLNAAKDSPMLIHFRVRTHGDISIPNTQPIQIDNNTAFIHNGVINCVPNHKNHSDTVMFSRMVLRRIRPGFHNHQRILDMIDKVVGFSKLVFLGTDKTVGLVGEKMGDWDNGIWYSNRTHVTYREKKSPSNVVVVGGSQRHLDIVPTRLLPSSTADAPEKNVSEPVGYGSNSTGKVGYSYPVSTVKENVRVELADDMRCQGCNDPFIVSEVWHEMYGKHMVCYSCYQQFKKIGLNHTASGTFTKKMPTVDHGTSWEVDQAWRQAYGCD